MSNTPTDRRYMTSMIRPEAIEFAKKWIADLRSGNFKQGAGKLHRRHGDEQQFCCLGVACKRIFDDNLIPNFMHKLEFDGVEIYGLEAEKIDPSMKDPYKYFKGGDSSAALLPKSARDFIFGSSTDDTDPRIYLTFDEYVELQNSELGQTMVPNGEGGEQTFWSTGYARQDMSYRVYTYEFSLMSMNDGGVPFTVIADMIEKFMLPAE